MNNHWLKRIDSSTPFQQWKPFKDLEDQVASLVAQNNKLEYERNEWCEKAIMESKFYD